MTWVVIVAAALAIVIAITVGAWLVWRRVVLPRQRRAAAALYTSVQLQLLTHAAMAALLDEARQSVSRAERRAP